MTIHPDNIQDPLSLLKKHGEQNHQENFLEVAQIIGNEIIDVRYFSRGQSVTLGSKIGYQLSFSGTPIAWVPHSFLTLSWLMYPLAQTKEMWKSSFYAKEEETLVDWDAQRASLSLSKEWNIRYVHPDGTQEELPQSSEDGYRIVSLKSDEHLLLQREQERYSIRYVMPKQKTTISLLKQIDTGTYGIAAGLLLSMMSAFLMFMNYTPPPVEIEKKETRQMIEAMLFMEEAPEPKDKILDITLDEAKIKPEEHREVKGTSKTLVNGPSGISESKTASDFIAGLNFGTSTELGIDEGLGNAIASINISNPGQGGIGSNGISWGSPGFGGGGDVEGIGGIASDRPSSVGRPTPQRVKRNKTHIKTYKAPTILGGMDKSLIDNYLKRQLRIIQYCYERELQKNPSLEGKLTMKFVINSEGSVSKAEAVQSTLKSKKVEGCIENRFLKFKFPKPNGLVIVRYPFMFSNK